MSTQMRNRVLARLALTSLAYVLATTATAEAGECAVSGTPSRGGSCALTCGGDGDASVVATGVGAFVFLNCLDSTGSLSCGAEGAIDIPGLPVNPGLGCSAEVSSIQSLSGSCQCTASASVLLTGARCACD